MYVRNIMKRIKLGLFPRQTNTDFMGETWELPPLNIEIPVKDYRKIFTCIDDFDGDILSKLYKYYAKNVSRFDPIFANEGFLLFLNLALGSTHKIYQSLISRWYDINPSRRDDHPYRPFVTDDELKELKVKNMLEKGSVVIKDGVVQVKGYKKELRNLRTEIDPDRSAYDKKMLKVANEDYKLRKRAQRKFGGVSHRRTGRRY